MQEVFVTRSGDEIPSGERFVTKSLHDEPVKSWKERKAEELEVLYQKLDAKKNVINIEIRKLEAQKKAHQELIKNNLKVIERTTALSDEDIDLIACVASGFVKWTVDNHYWWKPQPFDKETFRYDGRFDYRDATFEGIKMITLLGVGVGKYRFEINQWSDGSGASKGAKFFKDDQQLKDFLLKKVEESESLSVEQIESLSKFIDVPQPIIDTAVTTLKENAKAAYEKAVSDAKDRMEESLERINGKQ